VHMCIYYTIPKNRKIPTKLDTSFHDFSVCDLRLHNNIFAEIKTVI